VAYRLNQKGKVYLWLPYQPSITTSVALNVDDPGHHHFHENFIDLLNQSEGRKKSILNKYKLQIINDDDQLSIITILSHGDGIKGGKM
jgi:hypothetical protein